MQKHQTTFVNYIRLPEGSKDVEYLVKEAKDAVDILGRDNLCAVRLNTGMNRNNEEKVCPCVLEFYLKPVNENYLIPVEVNIYGVTSGNFMPSTEALCEILAYAGFEEAKYQALHKIFFNERIKK